MRPLPVVNPPNPWHTSFVEYIGEAPNARLQVYDDHSRSILSKNDSPDIPFRYSVNPYRGCVHACAYCYARPSHEHLGFGAGTDFDRSIVVKREAPLLLREAFLKPSWRGDAVTFSGVTDCYQALEASYELTRGCLAVCVEFCNPVGIITKAPLIERDISLLCELAACARVHVAVSIPFWNEDHARAIEPYVATPQRRMKTVEKLRGAGIDVTVLVAPVIPGLNDEDIGDILRAAANAGAKNVAMGVLRLPGSTREVFLTRLRASLPLRAEKVIAKMREARGETLDDARFGTRMRGEGNYLNAIHGLFAAQAKRLGLNASPEPDLDDGPRTFRRPAKAGAQLGLFGDETQTGSIRAR